MSGRTGRRPDGADTRAAILAAARSAFADVGFERATIRRIAAAAGVDPALVHHYFGTKSGLLAAAMDLPLDPSALISTVMPGPREELGPRLVRAVLGAWDQPGVGERVAAVMRVAASQEEAADLLRAAVLQLILQPLTQQLGTDRPQLRAALVGSHLAGVALGRYVLKLPPLVDVPVADLVAAMGPTVQRYLVDPLW